MRKSCCLWYSQNDQILEDSRSVKTIDHSHCHGGRPSTDVVDKAERCKVLTSGFTDFEILTRY